MRAHKGSHERARVMATQGPTAKLKSIKRKEYTSTWMSRACAQDEVCAQRSWHQKWDLCSADACEGHSHSKAAATVGARSPMRLEEKFHTFTHMHAHTLSLTQCQ